MATTGTREEARLEELRERAREYQPPSVDGVDPSFIYLSPTVMQRSDFDALDEYNEPVEPKVIEGFDYERQKRETVESAHAFVREMAGKLGNLESDYDKIFLIMRSKRYRAGTVKQTRFDENREVFRSTIESHIAEGSPLEFVLPSFPYKFDNPVKVARKSPDMAEVLCLSQLYEICVSLKQVYEPGVRFTIISDGQLYQSLFAITAHEALSYREEVRDMIKRLGYDDMLDLTDMWDHIEAVRDEYESVKSKLRPVLSEWWERNPDNQRRLSLIKSSSPNINTALSPTHDLVQMATKDILLEPEEGEVLENFQRVRSGVRQRSEESAFEFALVLYTLKELDLVLSFYPCAIRATVHPKPQQWGLHLVNRDTQVFPWQGVALKRKNGTWTVKYEFDAVRRRAVPVHIDGEMFPFYYEEQDDSQSGD